jgi:hypothetical protein
VAQDGTLPTNIVRAVALVVLAPAVVFAARTCGAAASTDVVDRVAVKSREQEIRREKQ